MNPRTVARVALGYLALVSLQLGLWALLAPQSFFDDFPGLGRSWVATDGPYNEHLVRDVGALNLALAVLVLFAAIKATRELVLVAGLASLAWGVPHLIYHIVNSDKLSAGDNVFSLGGLAAFALLAGLLVYTAKNLPMTNDSNQTKVS